MTCFQEESNEISSCIHPNILTTIGNTPIVQLNKIPKKEGLSCRVLVKCEFFNPGGSVKDRIALAMVEDAEDKGLLVPGKSTIIEPTSGNTGIGLAMVGAVKGYKVIVTMPEKMSMEKVNLLKSLGADVRRTPTNVPHDHPESHISLARRLQKEIPNSIILDQYSNINNPTIHEQTTAEEILQATDNGKNLNILVIGAGTGGTVAGVGKKIKNIAPHVKIIAVDPLGSLLSSKKKQATISKDMYLVEGIGYDFIPNVLDYSVIDEWISVNDKDSFLMARRLISEEGLLCGGSSGSAVSVAMKLGQTLSAKETMLIILPDSVRNYMTKFIKDDWMAFNKFIEYPVIELQETLENSNILDPFVYCESNITLQEAAKQFFKNENAPPFIIVTKEKPLFSNQLSRSNICGILTLQEVFKELTTRSRSNTKIVFNPLEPQVILGGSTSINSVLGKMNSCDSEYFIVSSSKDENTLIGIITKKTLTKALLGL